MNKKPYIIGFIVTRRWNIENNRIEFLPGLVGKNMLLYQGPFTTRKRKA
jgi:hypothetical protein